MNKPEISPKLTLVAAAMATVMYSGQSSAADICSTADLAEGTPNTCAAPTATLTTNGQSINTGAGSVTTTNLNVTGTGTMAGLNVTGILGATSGTFGFLAVAGTGTMA
ncbi:MAG: hypothetical protein WBN90_04055, partial [Gammaproteobacteria bacterium]